jgi:hypothetical protein
MANTYQYIYCRVPAQTKEIEHGDENRKKKQ